MSDSPATPAGMDHEQFRAALETLGLRQTDFARLLRYLSGQPVDIGSVNRWATGKRSVPPAVTATLKLLAMLPRTKLREITKDAGGEPPA